MSDELRMIRDELQEHLEWVYALRRAPLTWRAKRSANAAAGSLMVVNEEIERELAKLNQGGGP